MLTLVLALIMLMMKLMLVVLVPCWCLRRCWRCDGAGARACTSFVDVVAHY